MSPHYDTTNASPEELEQYNKQTATQDNRIACFFESNPDDEYTPWEIQALVFNYPPPPITSVRRSMSDLTKAHVLTKTTHKKEVGAYGRRSYAWTLNKKYEETHELLAFADQEQVQAILDEIDKDLGHEIDRQGLTGDVRMGDLLEPVLEGAKKIEAVKQAKTSPQGKLFNIPPVVSPPVHCLLCHRELTAPVSMVKGVGPVCEGKCREAVEILAPKGKEIRI